MSKFKVGDKVVRIAETDSKLIKGNVYTVFDVYMHNNIELEGYDYRWSDKFFELYKEEPKVKQFDLKKDKWYISTPTEEASKLAQEWLFEQGFVWQSTGSSDNKVRYTDTKYLMISLYEKGAFCWSTPKHIEGHEEIILTYKTAINTITFPTLPVEPEETDAQKQLKVLKDQIAELSKQAELLEGSL